MYPVNFKTAIIQEEQHVLIFHVLSVWWYLRKCEEQCSLQRMEVVQTMALLVMKICEKMKEKKNMAQEKAYNRRERETFMQVL